MHQRSIQIIWRRKASDSEKYCDCLHGVKYKFNVRQFIFNTMQAIFGSIQLWKYLLALNTGVMKLGSIEIDVKGKQGATADPQH